MKDDKQDKPAEKPAREIDADFWRRFAQMEETIGRLAAMPAVPQPEIAAIVERLAALEAEVSKLRRAQPEAPPMTQAEYVDAYKAGVVRFRVLADCRHPKMTVLKGAEIRAVDIDQPVVQDLIGKGLLKIRAA